MANAQNLRSAALPPAGHLQKLRIPRAPNTPDDPWSSAPVISSLNLEADEGDTIALKRSDSTPMPASRPPTLPPREAHDIVRAAVEQALAPVRDRLEDLERVMLEVMVRVANAPAPADTTVQTERAERERRQVLVLMGCLVVLNVATLLGVFASQR